MAVDEARVAAAVREILLGIGEDPDRDGLKQTPARVAKAYSSIFEGMDADAAKILSTTFDLGHDELVLVRDIEVWSTCEHHLVPFTGVAHVGYIPDGRVVGISKLARVVEGFAKRPQIQEQLTSQIAEAIMEVLKPDGVAVVIEAEHLCMTMRGVKKPDSRMVTSAMRGDFKQSAVTRAEFLSLVQGSR